MKRNPNRFVALILSVLVLFGAVSVSVYADGDDTPQRIIDVQDPAVSTVDLGDKVIIHASCDLPEDARIVWKTSGSGFGYINPSADVIICECTSAGAAVIKAAVEKDGEELGHSRTVQLKARTGLWLFIVSLFKNIFGINRIVSDR